jgi:hypothetical protein
VSDSRLFYSESGDSSDEGVPEFHFVEGVLYLCHEGDHYCPSSAGEEAA